MIYGKERKTSLSTPRLRREKEGLDLPFYGYRVYIWLILRDVIAYTIDLRRPMTLSADWAASDQIHALLGYDFFYAEKGMFARYAHNDEVWIKLKYNF